MLVRDPHTRLYGQAVRNHLFFEPISGIWDDIAKLKHPPLPRPLSNSVSTQRESKILLSREVTQTKPKTQEKDRSPVVPKSILKRRPSHVENLPVTDPEVTSNNDGIPDYIVPWVDPEPEPQVCGSCAASLESPGKGGDDTARVLDSSLIIPEDLPPPLDDHVQLDPSSAGDRDSPMSSASSYVSTPKSNERLSISADIDDELLSAAEACRNLEVYLSTGFYFNELPVHAESPVHAEVHTPEPIPLPSVSDSPSLISNNLDSGCDVDEPVSPIEVTDRDPPIHLSDQDNAADWSFENEITMAVLDAMNQRSKSPLREEIELGVLEPQLSSPRGRSRSSQTRNSIRQTFESFRRKIRPIAT